MVLCLCLPAYLSVCLSLCLPVYLPVCLPVYLSIFLSAFELYEQKKEKILPHSSREALEVRDAFSHLTLLRHTAAAVIQVGKAG